LLYFGSFLFECFLVSLIASATIDPSAKRIQLLQEEKDARDRQIAELTRQLTHVQASLTTEQERNRGSQSHHSESEAKLRQVEQELARVKSELTRAQSQNSQQDNDTKRELGRTSSAYIHSFFHSFLLFSCFY
jgi:chromosome segregation ATPase